MWCNVTIEDLEETNIKDLRVAQVTSQCSYPSGHGLPKSGQNATS